MIAENLSVFFNEFAVDVTVSGGSTFKAVFDTPDELVGQFGVSTEHKLTAKTSDLASLTEGATVAIDGVNYAVRSLPRKIDDGALSSVQIDKV
jgi:hypothetical protein